MREGRNGSTSGHVDPKPHRQKFRQDSQQPLPSERLRDAAMEKSKLRSEKTGVKLDQARDTLSKQKPPKKPGPVKSLGRAAKLEVWMYAHGKIHEVEHENVGVEAAHKAEIAGEGAVRGVSRLLKKRIRTRPARRVQKWEKRDIKAKADFQYRKMVQENPEMKKNTLSKVYQKQRLKKRYQKQAREAAKKGAKAANKTAGVAGKLFRAFSGMIRRHPVVLGIVLGIFLLFVVIQVCVAALSSIGNGVMGMVSGTSYLAEDADIDDAELAYTEWETDLLFEIKNAKSTHPGYDEYRYNVGEISHNPYELLAFLTAAYNDFTYSGIEGILRQVFNEQYTLSFVEEVEVRNETRTNPQTGESYTVQVRYKILNATLTARSFSDVVFSRMSTEQLGRFNVLMKTKGNRQYLQSPFGDLNWLPYVTSYYGYRVHPISGAKDYHMGADIALPEGTAILAGQDGIVTFAGQSGGYGLVVVLDNGKGLVSKYAHCSALLVQAGQTAKAGDVIAKVGSTGNSTGAHLHLEIVKDGRYLNPLYFAVTNDYQGPDYSTNPGAAMGDERYAALIAEAEKYLGYPYVWGGSSPATSFDCSGYICWILNQSGVASVPRTTAQGLYNMCVPVSPSDAKPGDLIFFTGTYSSAEPVTHIGLYVGNGQMIHCGNPISYANVNSSYWQSHFYAFGRLK